jgi:hypothetical protein
MSNVSVSMTYHARAGLLGWSLQTHTLSQGLIYKHIPTQTRSSTALPRQPIAPSLSFLTTKPKPIRSAIKRNMSSTNDHADITKQNAEKDGSFKRMDSTFRNFIGAGSEFEPEAGMYPWALLSLHVLMPCTRPVPSLCLLCLSCV